MKTILDLPPEILTTLFRRLPGVDLASVSRVCSKFNQAVNVDSVWQERCHAEYNITTIGSSFTFRDVYTKCFIHRGILEFVNHCWSQCGSFVNEVLYRYGSLLGVWRYKGNHYGGLYKIKFDCEKIYGVQYTVPKNNSDIKKPLVVKTAFTITIDGGEMELIRWMQELMDEALPDWRFTEDLPPVNDYTKLGRYIKEKGLGICDRIDTQKELENSEQCPIKPGLFVGTYGPHGLELILFRQNKESRKFEGFKITGDPNIPADETTITVDLNRPMVLYEEQQMATRMLSDIDTPDLPMDVARQKMANQVFCVPMDVWVDHLSHDEIPRRCRARYHSKGQIAAHNYHDPNLSPGHFIVFDENMLGHIWLELRSFSVYYRVTDDIL